MTQFFQGRKAAIATMHGKELVLSPVLQDLGIDQIVTPNIDTDQFGTFSGEKERLDDPLQTLRKKCLLAHEHTGIDVVIASEGSFGAHPFIPFASADEEIVMLRDYRCGLEVIVKELSTETNFAGKVIEDRDDLLLFAENAGFPEHALILKSRGHMEKGITNSNQLIQVFYDMMDLSNARVWVETDMRAMHNPTRMKVIAQCATKLKESINSLCPECLWPDFTIKKMESGLPCGLCQMPTESIKLRIKICDKCGAREEIATEKKYQDPMYCNHCNP